MSSGRRSPGRWRADPIYVQKEETEEIVDEGIDVDSKVAAGVPRSCTSAN